MTNKKLSIAMPWIGLKGGRSGLDVYARNLVKILSQQIDIDLHIWARKEDIERESLRQLKCTLHEIHCKGAWKEIIWVNTQFLNEIKKASIDLVHFVCHRRIPFIKLYIKVVSTVHDILPLEGKRSYGWKHTFYHYLLFYMGLKNLTKVIVPTQAVKKAIVNRRQAYKDKVAVIPHGIDHNTFYPMDYAKSLNTVKEKFFIQFPYFIYVSRIEHPLKNHYRLIKAFEKYKSDTGSENSLVFVGYRWPGSSPIYKMHNESLYKDQIHFLSDIDVQDLRLLYSGAKASIIPTLGEGFGFSLLESCACGCPVACSAIEVLKENAPQCTLFFDPYNIDSIASSFEKMEFQKRDDVFDQLILHVASYSWGSYVKEMIKVYRSEAQS